MDMQFLCEVLGTVAFSISGAVIGVKREMDIFGVVVLGIVTALGGGLLRDIILNTFTPSMFVNTTFLYIAILTSLYVFFLMKDNKRLLPLLSEEQFEALLNIIDAIGLAMFTIVGVNTSFLYQHGHLACFSIFLGVLTGVGGGVIRDLFAGVMPQILRKHVYASASLIGAIVYYHCRVLLASDYPLLLCATIIIAIRVAAYHYRWKLPKIRSAGSCN